MLLYEIAIGAAIPALLALLLLLLVWSWQAIFSRLWYWINTRKRARD